MSLRARNTISGVVLAIIAAVVVFGIYKALFPAPGDGYYVYAEFKDLGGLTKNSDVKIGGVPGGRVVDIKLTKNDTALVKMDLKKGAHPVGEGVSAASRPVNLLGEKYVDLNPGDLTKPLKSGYHIPLSKTSRPVELDDVLNILDPDVRMRLRILINEAGISMAGRAADFNTLLDRLPSALDETQQVVADFSADNKRLRTLIEQSDADLSSFVKGRVGLQNLVQEASDTLNITAEKREQIAQTFQNAPGALQQFRTTLVKLNATTDQLKPAAVDLQNAAGPLAATLDRLPAFQRDAQPALAALKTTAPNLTRLAVQGRPTVRRLRPTAQQLQKFSDQLAPVTAILDRGAFKRLMGLMNGWVGATGRTDGLSHLFRYFVTIDQELLTDATQRYVGALLPQAKKGKIKVRKVKPKAQTPQVQATATPTPATKLPKVPDVVKGLTDKLNNTVDQTVKGLTDGLVGPKGVLGPDGLLRGKNGLLNGNKSGAGANGASTDDGKTADASKLFNYLLGG